MQEQFADANGIRFHCLTDGEGPLGRRRGRKVDCPTLVLWGEQDPNLGRELTDDIQDYVRGPLQLQLFPEAGHWLIDDRPEEVAAHVIDFLAG